MSDNEMINMPADDEVPIDELLQEVLEGIDTVVNSITDTEIEARLHQLLNGPEPAAEIARDLVIEMGMDVPVDRASSAWMATARRNRNAYYHGPGSVPQPECDEGPDLLAISRMAIAERASWEATVTRVQADRMMADASRHLDRARAYLDEAVDRAGEIVAEARGTADRLRAEAQAQVNEAMAQARRIVDDAHQLASLIVADAEQEAGTAVSQTVAVPIGPQPVLRYDGVVMQVKRWSQRLSADPSGLPADHRGDAGSRFFLCSYSPPNDGNVADAYGEETITARTGTEVGRVHGEEWGVFRAGAAGPRQPHIWVTLAYVATTTTGGDQQSLAPDDWWGGTDECPTVELRRPVSDDDDGDHPRDRRHSPSAEEASALQLR